MAIPTTVWVSMESTRRVAFYSPGDCQFDVFLRVQR
jgi:hypothetical protein